MQAIWDRNICYLFATLNVINFYLRFGIFSPVWLVDLFACLFVCLFTWLFVCLFVCLFTWLFVRFFYFLDLPLEGGKHSGPIIM